jgi:hypothetical protein
MLFRLVGGRKTEAGCTQDLRRGTQCTSFLSFLVLIVITPRIATDLNLHQVSTTQPQTERQEREMLNRARVWMICFNIDRSTATQFGKPSTIKEDYITRHSADWYKQSRFRDKVCSDISFCFWGADQFCESLTSTSVLTQRFFGSWAGSTTISSQTPIRQPV